MADCRAGARKVQDIPEISFFHQKIWSAKKKMMEAWHKDTEASPEPAPTGQIWDNLSIKTNNDSYGV